MQASATQKSSMLCVLEVSLIKAFKLYFKYQY